MNRQEHSDDIEDALVSWWHARTLLDAAQARLQSGTESLEHVRALRTEQAALDVLYARLEAYLSLAASFPEALRPFDARLLLPDYAGRLAETPAGPPKPPARSVK